MTSIIQQDHQMATKLTTNAETKRAQPGDVGKGKLLRKWGIETGLENTVEVGFWITSRLQVLTVPRATTVVAGIARGHTAANPVGAGPSVSMTYLGSPRVFNGMFLLTLGYRSRASISRLEKQRQWWPSTASKKRTR